MCVLCIEHTLHGASEISYVVDAKTRAMLHCSAQAPEAPLPSLTAPPSTTRTAPRARLGLSSHIHTHTRRFILHPARPATGVRDSCRPEPYGLNMMMPLLCGPRRSACGAERREHARILERHSWVNDARSDQGREGAARNAVSKGVLTSQEEAGDGGGGPETGGVEASCGVFEAVRLPPCSA